LKKRLAMNVRKLLEFTIAAKRKRLKLLLKFKGS
jgi:hypothetical protein